MRVPTINYILGSPDITSGTYAFEQSPFCDYPETVALTNLPSFARHNESTKDFTISQTLDKLLVGEHSVTIRTDVTQSAIGNDGP